ncbi:MAG TPA: FtsX-like permease family protein [Rudaea sp.]|jgi:putative ABC transport system permease protein|uniref:FtsX-like permease family protein n=1 Tax=Rudaea sp. TaxID=2136325 RepID=UPI002F93F0E1
MPISPRWRKMLRDAWLHKARTLLVVLAVATGMIAAGALLDAWALVRRVTAETYQASHPVSATLHVDAVDDALLAQVRALPAITAARARRSVFATVESNGARLVAELYALQDFSAQDIGKLQPERGVWPPRDGEIVLERSSLDFSGSGLGESLALQVGKNPQHALPVTGIARDVSLPPGWMDHIVYAFVTPATLETLGVPATFDEIQIVVRDAAADRDAVRRIAYEVKALIERNGKQVGKVDVPVPGQHAHAAQMDSLMLTQGVFGLLTLLVCSFLIVNLITAMLAGQTREIGVMKALGAGPRQIGAMYLVFALLLGVLASTIALPAAIAIGRPYAALKADMLNFPIAGYAIPWWAIALQLAVGCLLPVAAAATPVVRACRMPVHAALSDPGIAAERGGFYLRRRIAIPGIGRPLQLSIGNAFRRRQRMLLTLLALAAGGAVYLGADNLRSAVRGSVDMLFSSQHYDVVLRMATAYPAAQMETTAANVEGVERVLALASASATNTHADGIPGNAFTVVGLPADSPMLVPVVKQGRWLDPSDRSALAISRALLKDEPTLTPGAQVTLQIDGQATPWTIVGIVEAGPQALAYAPRAALDALHGDDRASTLVVATGAHNAAAQLDVIARLRAELATKAMPVASSQLLSEARRVVEDHLLMVVEFLGAMAWVMIAVGGMGLASTMSLAVLERTREIGVMRAIGARHGAIMRMILAEGIVIAVLGWLVSLPLSVPMSAALASAFGRVMFSLPTRYAPGAFGALSWLLLIVFVSVLACVWPALRATRIPTAAALNYQ